MRSRACLINPRCHGTAFTACEKTSWRRGAEPASRGRRATRASFSSDIYGSSSLTCHSKRSRPTLFRVRCCEHVGLRSEESLRIIWLYLCRSFCHGGFIRPGRVGRPFCHLMARCKRVPLSGGRTGKLVPLCWLLSFGTATKSL
jgi:hypothetical protein